MGEAIGAAASITALVSLSGSILLEGYSFLSSVRKAPAELRLYLSEIAALNIVLDRLQTLGEDGEDHPGRESALVNLQRQGLVDSCVELLETVRRSIRRCEQVEGQEVRNVGRRVLWPFKEKETTETMERLGRLREVLGTALEVDMMSSLQRLEKSGDRIEGSLRVLHLHVHDEQHQKLRKWISPNAVNVDDNLEAALSAREPGTAEWVFKIRAFNDWMMTDSSLIWIKGIPGSGKTVLAASIIEQMLSQRASEDHIMSYFFCDHRDENKQSLRSFVETILLQVINQVSEGNAKLLKFFEMRSDRPTQSLLVSDLIDLLRSLPPPRGTVVVVLDALDESSEFDRYICTFRELMNPIPAHAKFKIVLTSRSDLLIEKNLAEIPKFTITLGSNVGADIRLYVSNQVDARITAKKLKLRNPHLKEEIIRTLGEGADGMFLWARLQLDLISRLSNDKAIREALGALPKGLDETYVRVLQDIVYSHPESVGEIQRLLTWLVASLVPLSLSQLAEIISIRPRDNGLDSDGIATDPEDIITHLGSLISVDRSQADPVISLAHFSISNFLQSDGISRTSVAMFSQESRAGHLALAATCIQYLSFSDFGQPCDSSLISSVRERRQKFKMLAYTAQRWLDHLRLSGIATDASVLEQLPRLRWFIEPDANGWHYTSWLQAIEGPAVLASENKPLYFAASSGLNGVVEILLKDKTLLESPCKAGMTPLYVASEAGRLDTVHQLLRFGARLEAKSTARMSTALHIAAERGHAATVQALLEAGASPHARSRSGSTPLYRAARNGSVAVLELLHAAGGDVNAKTWDNWAPICEAVTMEHPDATGILIRWGAKLDFETRSGYSPLYFAQRTMNQACLDLVVAGLAAEKNTTGWRGREIFAKS